MAIAALLSEISELAIVLIVGLVKIKKSMPAGLMIIGYTTIIYTAMLSA